MPGSFAHYSFGKAVLPQLPADVQQCIHRFRRMYDMGLQGPDLFLHYNRILAKNKILALGNSYHKQTGREFFAHACAVADSEAARAYLYGVLGHYCLDSACHPFVNKVVKQGEAGHILLESEFDRLLLTQAGNPSPHTYSVSEHIRLTRGECMTVARFYPPATGANVYWALVLMRFDQNFLAGGSWEKREKLLRRINPVLTEFMIPKEPVPGYTRMTSELLARYNRCMQQYPAMISRLQSYMESGAELGEQFEPTFG